MKSQKKLTFRTAMNRLKKVNGDLNLALWNPSLFIDLPPDKMKRIAESNLKYLKAVEKQLDKQLSEVGSLINSYKETSTKIEATENNDNDDKYHWCGTGKSVR